MKSAKPIIGKSRNGQPQDEREHFIQCSACGRCPDLPLNGENVI